MLPQYLTHLQLSSSFLGTPTVSIDCKCHGSELGNHVYTTTPWKCGESYGVRQLREHLGN